MTELTTVINGFAICQSELSGGIATDGNYGLKVV